MEGLVVIILEYDVIVIIEKEGQLSVEMMKSKVSISQVKVKFKEEFGKLFIFLDDMMLFVKFYSRQRVIIDVDFIYDLFFVSCQVRGCVGEFFINIKKVEGGVLTVIWVCSKGYSGVWNFFVLLG